MSREASVSHREASVNLGAPAAIPQRDGAVNLGTATIVQQGAAVNPGAAGTVHGDATDQPRGVAPGLTHPDDHLTQEPA